MTLEHPRCKDCHTKSRPCPRCEQTLRTAMHLGRIRRKQTLVAVGIPIQGRGF